MLKGTLDDFALPDIFRLVMVAKRTGKLDVSRSAGNGKVFFRDGEVYYAESTVAREPLGQKLIRSGGLTEGGLMKALDENASTGERVGEILVRNGSVSVEQLQAAVREQIEDSCFDLLRWDLGEFSWENGVIADVEVPISVSVENLIMESSRRLDELEVILRKIPSENAIPAMASAPPEGAVEINITPQEWRMLVLVNGVRTIHDIAQQVGLDDFSVMRGIYGLLSAGLVEIADRGETADQGAQTVEAVDPSQQANADRSVAEVSEQPLEEAAHEDETELQKQLDAEVEEILADTDLQVDEAPPAPEPALSEESEPVAEVSEDLEFFEPMAEAPEAPEVSEVPEHVAVEEFVAGEPSPDSAIDLDSAIAMAQAEADATDDSPSIYRDSFVADSLDSFDEGDAPAFQPLEEGKISFESFTDVTDNDDSDIRSDDNVIFMSSGDDEDEAEVAGDEPERRFEVLSGEDTAADDISTGIEDDPLDMTAWEPSVVGFDAPEADELTTTTPTEDPFLEDLFSSQQEQLEAPPAPEPVREAPAAPAAAAPKSEDPSVDRASVVRELAGLFSDDDRPRPRQAAPGKSPAAEGEEEDTRKRVEDDDQVTKGLISRLIDGVKGL